MDKDAIIEKLRQYIKLLEEKIQRLEEKIAQLEKNSSNSSKPPSSDIVRPLKILRRFGKKRERGGQHGHRRFLRQPFEPQQVDEVIEYELEGKDAVGLICADYWGGIPQICQAVLCQDAVLSLSKCRMEYNRRKRMAPITSISAQAGSGIPTY